jgi:hypothetical protein
MQSKVKRSLELFEFLLGAMLAYINENLQRQVIVSCHIIIESKKQFGLLIISV